MALNNITFTLGSGNLGRTQPGSDYISGYLIYSNTVPSGMTSSVPKQVFSLSGAEALGIVGDYSDETKATAQLLVGATGSVGDSTSITIVEPNINSTTNTTTITYYRQASDTTTTLLASSIVNAINASGTGYTAISSTASITLSSRPGMGTVLNSGTYLSVSNGGTTLMTVGSQFTGGVASIMAPIHYQISEYFRLNVNGVLWVGFYPTGSTTFSEFPQMQSSADGQIRQFMFNSSATSTSTMLSELDLINAQCDIMFNNYRPASVIYSPNFNGISDLSSLPNLRAKSDKYMSVVISQDGGNLGAWLALTTGKSVPTLGACLGTISKSKVSESIAWVQKFNISDGSENETISFINKNLWRTIDGTNPNLINQLNNYGYIFLRKVVSVSGSYFNDSNCAVSITSDYAYIENNRTIDKGIRNAYINLAPLINSPVYFNTDSTLSDITIATFQNSVKPELDAMVTAGELSGYSITVDPNEKTQTTGIIKININLLGIGVSRNIQVGIAFVLSL